LPQKLHEIKGVNERQSRNYRDWDGWDDASRAVWVPDEDRIKILIPILISQLFWYSRIAVTCSRLAEHGHLSEVSADAVRITRIEVEGHFGPPLV